MRSILLVILVTGCSAHTHVSVNAGNSNSGVFVHADGGTALAALLGLSVLFGSYAVERGSEIPTASSQYVPELDPGRKVSEQDCTKPVDYTLGNIRCK